MMSTVLAVLFFVFTPAKLTPAGAVLSPYNPPARWFFRLYGAEADKARGIQIIEETAHKGHYLLPFARLLLAVAALRDNEPANARELLQNLADEFPGNPLYQQELKRLQ